MTTSQLQSPSSNLPALPSKLLLTRSEVEAAVGGRRIREQLEREKRLTRGYYGGLKHARYRLAQVKQVLDDLGGSES